MCVAHATHISGSLEDDDADDRNGRNSRNCRNDHNFAAANENYIKLSCRAGSWQACHLTAAGGTRPLNTTTSSTTTSTSSRKIKIKTKGNGKGKNGSHDVYVMCTGSRPICPKQPLNHSTTLPLSKRKCTQKLEPKTNETKLELLGTATAARKVCGQMAKVVKQLRVC